MNENEKRAYDAGLVQKIRERERVETVDGTPVLMKPIPDDDRLHVLDPRVREVARRKRDMFAQRAEKAGGAYSLANERNRPDKVTVDLTEGEVSIAEQLIPVNDTHMIDVFSYRPEGMVDGAPAYVFLHGGGFTAGCERIYHNQMKFIAEKSKALVVFPEYRLAPEAPFPAAIDDCCATVRWVYDHADELGIDCDKIMVGGDSAGGALTSACVLKDAEGHIKRAFLLFPGSDSSDYRTQKRYTWSYDSYPVVEEDRELMMSRVDRIRTHVENDNAGNLYLQGKTTVDDPLVSAAYASDDQLRAFPPTVIAVSEYDYLRLGSEYVGKRMHELGCDVQIVRYLGVDHGFLDMFGFEPQAEEVCLAMADEIAKL